jgi:hypothetical protein
MKFRIIDTPGTYFAVQKKEGLSWHACRESLGPGERTTPKIFDSKQAATEWIRKVYGPSAEILNG